MSPPTSEELAFVSHLRRLVERGDRGALAALRRGLGKEPGGAPEMYPHVVPYLPTALPLAQEAPFYVVAALFALHPLDWPGASEAVSATNLGASFARLRAADPDRDQSVERRFVALLDAPATNSPEYLRHAVSLLRARDIPVDWAGLLADLRSWNHPNRTVQRRWARAFWTGRPTTKSDEDKAAS